MDLSIFIFITFLENVSCQFNASVKSQTNSPTLTLKASFLKECEEKCLGKHEMHTLDIQINKTFQ